jgi:hypothetical protein
MKNNKGIKTEITTTGITKSKVITIRRSMTVIRRRTRRNGMRVSHRQGEISS